LTEDKRSDLFRKIQGLLAKAESTEHEGERQVFMAKADELMMKYRIELWELQQHQAGRVKEREPVVKDFDYAFAFDTGPFPEINEALWSVFISTAGFTNCVLVYHKQHFSAETNQWKSRTIPVIGTESDLAYLELLFSSLLTQLVDQIRPKYDPDKDYYQNLRTFREAGWNWLEVAKVMQENGHHTDVTQDKARHLTAHAYRRWCKRPDVIALGITQNYANWKTYRRNFADGWAERINHRMWEMRESERKVQVGGTGMDLVLQDQMKLNLSFMDEMFPKQPSKGGRMVKYRDSRKFDSAAYSGGRAAGERANISSHPGKGVKPGSGKQIGG
jgi:hypothetical protein